MKKNNLLLKQMAVGVLLTLCSFGADAAERLNPDEVVLKSSDGACAIHYLTPERLVRHYIETSAVSCPNGWVSGYAAVTIHNEMNQLTERIQGYFKDGYWMGNNPLNAPIISRFTPEKGVQALSFDLGNESMMDMHFFGQARVEITGADAYGAFDTCDPVRILAVTQKIHLFEEESTQQDLIYAAIERAKSLCDEPDIIYLFGATEEQPAKEDIVFFADINLSEKQIRVRRLPSSPRRAEVTDKERVSAIPMPTVIRQEGGMPLVQVTPIMPVKGRFESNGTVSVKEEPLRGEDLSADEQITDVVVSEEREEEVSSVMKEIDPLTVKENREPIMDQRAAVDAVVTPTVPDGEKGLSKGRQNGKEIKSSTVLSAKDKVPHLLAASRILGEPVKGQAAVHIARTRPDGVAEIDAPLKLEATGAFLPDGWIVVNGNFMWTGAPGEKRESPYKHIWGRVRVKSFGACDEMDCPISKEGE